MQWYGCFSELKRGRISFFQMPGAALGGGFFCKKFISTNYWFIFDFVF